jgi:competence protein ComEC
MRALWLLLGMLLAIWLPGGWRVQASLSVLVLAMVCLARRGWRQYLPLGLGFFLALQAALRVLGQQVPCDERVLATAHVATVPQRQAAGWQFDAILEFPRQPERSQVRARVTSAAGMTRPQAGETWQLALQLRGAGGGSGNAQRQRALLRDRIGVEARVIRSRLNARQHEARSSLLAIREKLARKIDQRVADPAAAALLSALAVGVTGDVSRQQWRVFSATGITHLVAISGMHVTFFAMLSMALARRLWAWVPGVARVRRESFAATVGIVLAAAYALLSGFSVPAQRTLVMLVALLLARESGRACGALWSVAVALVAVLCWDPLAVLGAGFWLSFAAVAAIIMTGGAQLRPPGALRAAAWIQVVVSVALLPVTLLLFGSFSTAGLLVNVLAIPVFTFLLVPPILLATLGYLLPGNVAHWVSGQLVDLAARVAAGGWPWLAQAADLRLSLLHSTPVAAWYLLALPAVALILMPWRPLARWMGVIILLAVLMMRPALPPPGEIWLDVLDVGAATAAVVTTPGRQLVFGTAEAFGSRGRRFEERVVRRLEAARGRKPVMLVIGTANADRMRAVVAADALLQVGLVAGSAGPPEIAACNLRSWEWDGVRFDLSAGAGGSSCVLAVRVGDKRIVLAQDAAGSGSADVILLPRNARIEQAASISETVRTRGIVLASTDLREWQASRWRGIRQALSGQRISFFSTATEGSMHLEIRSGSPIRLRRNRGTEPGIWSGPRRDHSCADGL